MENHELLKKLLSKISYKKNWGFDTFLTPDQSVFRVSITCTDSTGKHQTYSQIDRERTYYSGDICRFDRPIWPNEFWVVHNFPIPSYEMDEETMLRWLFDRIVDIETHEAMEFFKFNKTVIYFPDHEPGSNPYLIKRR